MNGLFQIHLVKKRGVSYAIYGMGWNGDSFVKGKGGFARFAMACGKCRAVGLGEF